MKTASSDDAIHKKFQKLLGPQLVVKIGKDRVTGIATEIAGYKERFSWANDESEKRRLQESVRYLSARILINVETDSRFLSKKDFAALGTALNALLNGIFPFLRKSAN